MRRPARIATRSGAKGESPAAIKSAFTKRETTPLVRQAFTREGCFSCPGVTFFRLSKTSKSCRAEAFCEASVKSSHSLNGHDACSQDFCASGAGWMLFHPAERGGRNYFFDHHFGELSPEDAVSLEARLAVDVAAQEEAKRVLATLATARRTVVMHLELVRPPDTGNGSASISSNGNWPTLAQAAAIVLLAALSASVGFLAGRSRSTSSQTIQPASNPNTSFENSPWTCYRIASNQGAGFQIVRLENHQCDNTSIK